MTENIKALGGGLDSLGLLEPSHDNEAERAVLGCMLRERAAVGVVVGILPESKTFYVKRHAILYDAIRALAGAGVSVDFVTLRHRLQADGTLEAVGGVDYLLELYEAGATPANVGDYAAIVRGTHDRRTYHSLLVRNAHRFTENGRSLSELLDALQHDLDTMREAGARMRPALSAGDIAAQVFEEFNDPAAACAQVVGTGLPSLDGLLGGGFDAGQLILIGARPAVGKSALLGFMALAAARKGKRVLFASLEMSAAELFRRLLSAVARKDSYLLNRFRGLPGGAEKDSVVDALTPAIATVRALPISFDCALSTVGQVESSARHLQDLGGLDIVFLDYLQLLAGNSRVRDREERVADNSRALKRLAVGVGVPIVAASQLNRMADHERPRLSHLRESGALEQDADVVLLLHRPHDSDPTVLDCEVAKHRMGPCGAFRLTFKPEVMTFEE